MEKQKMLKFYKKFLRGKKDNMKKYLIQCPICKTFHEVKAGYLGTNFVDCQCGYTINVKDSRFVSKKCPHCGNMIVCDQKLGDSALCPICHQPVNAVEDRIKFVDISCPYCNSKNRVDKTAQKTNCTICGKEINVQQIIASEKCSNSEEPLLIKYDGGDGVLCL